MKEEIKYTLIALALSAAHAGAAITVHHHWEFGEGATAGTDAIAGANLTTVGSTSNTGGSPSGSASTIAQDFTNTPTEGTATNYMTYGGSLAAGLGTAGNNWGVEVWVNTDIHGGGSNPAEIGILHIGGTAQPALALEIFNSDWLVHRPGATFETQGAATIGQWTHLVYLGTGQVYVDGALSSGTSPGTMNFPSLPSGAPSFTVGSMWSNNRRGFDGQLDDLRLFSFQAGQFDISDTLRPIPEPSSLAFIGLAGLGLLRRRRK